MFQEFHPSSLGLTWDGADMWKQEFLVGMVPSFGEIFWLVCGNGGHSPPLQAIFFGPLAVARAPVTVGEIILKDVWSGFSFSGEALPALEDLALVKSNSIPLSLPEKHK